MRLLCLAFIFSIAPLVCRAEGQSWPTYPALAAIQAKLDRCKDANPGNIPEMLCTIEASKAVDAVLNKLYDQIIAKLKAPSGSTFDDKQQRELLKRLIASERAWIAFRDADCSHQSGYMLDGSGEPSMYGGCQFQMRWDRVNRLFNFYKGRFPDIGF